MLAPNSVRQNNLNAQKPCWGPFRNFWRTLAKIRSVRQNFLKEWLSGQMHFQVILAYTIVGPCRRTCRTAGLLERLRGALDQAKVFKGVEQAVLVDVVGDVVGRFLDFWPAVAHRHVEGTQLKHGEVDLCVAKADCVRLVGA